MDPSIAQETLLIQLLTQLLEIARTHPHTASVISGIGLLTSVVGIASLILEPMAILARSTATDADDKAVTVIGRVVKLLTRVLAVFARDTGVK